MNLAKKGENSHPPTEMWESAETRGGGHWNMWQSRMRIFTFLAKLGFRCCNAPWLVCPSYHNIYIIRETVLHRFFNDHFQCHFIRFCLLVYGMVWCHLNGLSSELVEGWTKKSVGMSGPPAEKCGITAETCSNTVWKLCGSSIPTPLKYVGHAGTHCCGWHVNFLLYI